MVFPGQTTGLFLREGARTFTGPDTDGPGPATLAFTFGVNLVFVPAPADASPLINCTNN